MVFLGGAFPSCHFGNFGGPSIIHLQFVILPPFPPLGLKIVILGGEYIFNRMWNFTNMFSHLVIFGIAMQKSLWVSPNPSNRWLLSNSATLLRERPLSRGKHRRTFTTAGDDTPFQRVSWKRHLTLTCSCTSSGSYLQNFTLPTLPNYPITYFDPTTRCYLKRLWQLLSLPGSQKVETCLWSNKVRYLPIYD